MPRHATLNYLPADATQILHYMRMISITPTFTPTVVAYHRLSVLIPTQLLVLDP